MSTESFSPLTVYQKLVANLNQVVSGQNAAIRKLLAAFASGGHVLLEDLPGTGKTTLAKTLAQSLQLDFQRIQFTPDLLPSDIVGVSIFDAKTQNFRIHRGPVFTEILLADEINRASPRTQSALLEAMGEGQVSLEGTRHQLSPLFFVIATQNPIEFHGTYPLPEAQMDRFALRFSLGYVSLEQEIAILSTRQTSQYSYNVSPCLSHEEIEQWRKAVFEVRVSDELKRYIVALVQATRTAKGVLMGASPRASLALMKTAQAIALFEGKTFVTPEHVQELAVSVLAHRLKLDSQARFTGTEANKIVEELLQTVPVPI